MQNLLQTTESINTDTDYCKNYRLLNLLILIPSFVSIIVAKLFLLLI